MNTLCKFVLAAGIGVAYLFPAPAHAEFGMGGWHHKGGKNWEEMKERKEKKMQAIFDQLGLSEEQKKTLTDNKAKHKAAAKERFEAVRQNMQVMGEEMKKTDLDMNKINALHAASKDLHNQMADERFNAILEVRKTLTPEQFAKFIELMEKEHKGMKHNKNKQVDDNQD
jgi:Spy/CpxP family protein refolding chaperone